MLPDMVVTFTISKFRFPTHPFKSRKIFFRKHPLRAEMERKILPLLTLFFAH